MQLDIFQVDAFAQKTFQGNPAAVCPLQEWLPDALMQNIAAENNLSETAFFVKHGKHYEIRWFTPNKEVKLCGHATLASAFILFTELKVRTDTIEFSSKSGPLFVTRNNTEMTMDFPANMPASCEVPRPIAKAFNTTPIACLKHDDYFLVFNTEDEVKNARPDLEQLKKIDLRAVCITAPSQNYDFVSRFFAPKYGIDEDPVTGSSFTQLIPYWATQLGKQTLLARQISARGGNVKGELIKDRVMISGQAVLYMKGSISI